MAAAPSRRTKVYVQSQPSCGATDSAVGCPCRMHGHPPDRMNHQVGRAAEDRGGGVCRGVRVVRPSLSFAGVPVPCCSDA